MTIFDPLPTLGAPLDVLCPMHVVLSSTGHIRHAGPTLAKIRTGALVGKRFLEVFELRRPRNVHTMRQLLDMHGSKLHMRFRDGPHTALQGVVVTLPEGEGAVVNLSFGISILEAVGTYDLTSADFAATDMAIEMLYLVEAKSAAMEASRTLNHRLQAAKVAAEEQAYTDTLTGLKNRRALDHILPRMIEAGKGFTLMQMDLDRFKAVNDTLGHAAGDFVLQQVARILVDEIRDSDDAARLGGDEFVLLFQGTIPTDVLKTIAARIIERIEVPMDFKGQPCTISASLGIISGDRYCQQTAEELLIKADQALYFCKENGRGQFAFYDEGKMSNVIKGEGG